MKKRVLAALLSLVMCLSCLPAGAAAAEYPDMPTGWSREAMEAAVENGLFRGDNLGRLDPGGLLTRAQMAAVVVRAFGAITPKDLTSYKDMEPNQWYYEDVAKAAHMGIMQGDGSRMAPDRSITRQEAFTVLARALRLVDGEVAALESFSDSGKVADWAAGAVAAMVSAGYVSGSGGMLNPTGNITREEFAQVMYNIFGTYYTQAGTYTDSPARSVMVNAPDVILKGIKVAGDIIIGDGVGDGDVTLDHVTLEGRLVVRGGGVNSVHIIGDEQAWFVVVAKVDGNVRVVADEGTKIETLTVEDGSNDIIIEGNVSTVSIETEGTTVILKDAKIDKLNVVAANTEVSMTGKTEVNYLSVTEVAQGTKVEAEKGVTISNVLADTDLTLEGEAKVEKIEGTGAVTDAAGEPVKETPTQPSYTPTYTPPQPSHEHTWVDGAILTPATCAQEGTKEQSCSCGQTQTAAIAKLPHTEETIPAVDATCTVGGLTAGKRCTVCHAVTEEQESTDPLGHDWDEGEVTTPATCTDTGVKTYTCTREGCGVTKTETLPKTDEHTWVAGETSTACGGTTTAYTCSVPGCDATKVEITGDEITHGEDETVELNRVEPTCAAEGSYVKVTRCSVCQVETADRETVTIPATGEHEYVTDVAAAPTCTDNGKTEGEHCSVCGHVSVAQATVPATGHSFSEEWTGDGDNHWHAATCEHTTEKKDNAAHNWNAGVVTKEPTCTEKGETTYTCTVCGATKTEEINELGHDFAAAWTSDETNHWHVCSRCQEKDSETEAAHIGTAIGEAKEPTCGAPGQTAGSKCSVCGKVLEPQAIRPATGEHNYGDWISADANNHKHTCSVCGDVKTEAHSFGEDNTCTACGYVKPASGTQVAASAGIEKIEMLGEYIVITAKKPSDTTGIRSFQVYMYDSQNEEASAFWLDGNPKVGDTWNVFHVGIGSFRAGYHYDKVRLNCWPEDGYERSEWNGDLTVNISSAAFPSCTAEMDYWQPEGGTQLWINLQVEQAISGFFTFHYYNSDTNEKLGTSYYTHSNATTTVEAVAAASEGFNIASMISLINAGKLQLQVEWLAREVIGIEQVNLTTHSSAKVTVQPYIADPVPAVTGFKFGRADLWGDTGSLILTPPSDESNIGSYLVYLKTNSGDWEKFAELYPGMYDTPLVRTDIADLPSGTYTEIKIVSEPAWNSGLAENSYTAPCTVTVNSNSYSGHTVSYYRSTSDANSEYYYFIVAENLPTFPEPDGDENGTRSGTTVLMIQEGDPEYGWGAGNFAYDNTTHIACDTSIVLVPEESLPKQYKMYAIGGVTYTDTTLNVTTTNFGGWAELPNPQIYTLGAYDPSNIQIYQDPGDLTVKVKYDIPAQIPDELKEYVQYGLWLTDNGGRSATPVKPCDTPNKPNEFDLSDVCQRDRIIDKNTTLQLMATTEIVDGRIGFYIPDDVSVHISKELDNSLHPVVSVSGGTCTVTGLGENAVADIQFSQWLSGGHNPHYRKITSGNCSEPIDANANYYRLTVYKTYEVTDGGKTFTCTIAYTDTDWVELPTEQ